ncbi:MAG: hypothetical protein ABJP45_10435 [Cyclobacteriaceae bacterium]
MRNIVALLLVGSSWFVSAQDVELSKGQLNLNLLPLTLSYEAKVPDKNSFTLSGGLGLIGYFESDGTTKESYFFALPVFTSSFRNYYTRKKIKKDDLRSNSGNYFGLFGSFQLEPLGDPSSLAETVAYQETTNVFTIGPVWGIERNYASGVHLGLSLGLGAVGGEYLETTVNFIGGFEFGMILFSK